MYKPSSNEHIQLKMVMICIHVIYNNTSVYSSVVTFNSVSVLLFLTPDDKQVL